MVDVRHILLTCSQFRTDWEILRNAVRGADRPLASVYDFSFLTGSLGLVRFVFGALVVFLVKSGVSMRS